MTAPGPEAITLENFQEALDRYDELIEAVSTSKGGANPGQKPLAELDVYRYVDAPARFASKKPGENNSPMQLQDVKTLLAWKLKHGKFRPTLMKLVSSNDEALVATTIAESLQVYERTADASAAVDILTRLKGIGPATASLLLAVHAPDHVIFFADEAFCWLCRQGRRDAAIKYNAKEYKELTQTAQDLAKRLDVKAVDIERVAYVLMNQNFATTTTAAKPPERKKKKKEEEKKEEEEEEEEEPPSTTSAQVQAESNSAPSKRKLDNGENENKGLRRSKRGKAS